MANKLTPKQEAFCLAYIETGNASEAYRQNYSVKNMGANSIRVEAHKLLKHPNISLRLEELHLASQERTLVTQESLTAEAEEVRELAMNLNQPSAAIAAILAKGKLNGLLVDKVEHESPKGTMTPKGVGGFYASTQPEEK